MRCDAMGADPDTVARWLSSGCEERTTQPRCCTDCAVLYAVLRNVRHGTESNVARAPEAVLRLYEIYVDLLAWGALQIGC